MNFLRQIVTLRNILLLLLLLAVLLAVWFLGPLLVIGGSHPLGEIGIRLGICLLVLAIFALVLGFNLLRQFWVRRRRLSDLARAERLSRRERMAVVDIDADLRDEFARAVETLDALSFGEGRKRLRGHHLPWFLLMGTPLSGKTALLRQSGLDFAIEPEPVEAATGLRPVKRLSWWAAEGGVLLDTAGGYLVEPGTRDHLPGWTALLALIKEYRPRRPLQGGIVVISLAELVTATPDERQAMAMTLRARLQEMFSALGTRFPIYLVASKADSLSGFSETYATLPEPKRAAVWGGLFPTELDFHDSQSQHVLDEIFSDVLNDAAALRDQRLPGDHDVSRRQRIFGFPEQLGFLLPVMADFIQAVFRSSRFEVKPLLRGFFITSARQNAQAVDVAIGRLVAPLKLTAPTVLAAQSGEASFFIRELFSGFIFPESGLAGFDPRLEKKRSRRSLLGMLIALAVLGVGSLAALSDSNVASYRIEQGDRDLIALLGQEAALTPDSSWQAQLKILNLSQQISAEYQGWLGSVIGFLSSSVRGQRYHYINVAAGKVYARSLKGIFLQRILFELEGEMNAALASADSPRLLRALTVYLMLDDPKHFQAETVRQWLNNDWQKNFLLPQKARAQLNLHLNTLLAAMPRNVPLDQTLIAAARQALIQLPTADNLYARLQAQAAQDQTLQPFQRGLALGATAPLSLSAPGVAGLNTQIPGLYTLQGFETYILQRLPQTASALSQDSWVLGPSPISGSGVASTLLDQVAALYSTDYIRYWDGAIRGLQLRQAPDLTTAIDALGNLSGPDSPIARLVSAIAANTNLVEPPRTATTLAKLATAAVGQGAVAAGTSAGSAVMANMMAETGGFTTWPGTAIQQHFASIIALAGGSSAAAASAGGSPMDQVRSLIAGAYSLLQGIAAAPNPQFAALNLLKSQSNGSVGNALSPLMTQASAYPPVVSGLLRQIALSTSAILADLAGQYIGMAWRQGGGAVCTSRIAGRYPFDRASSTDVALADFQNFFAPGGTMDNFYTTMIQPLGLTADGTAGGTATLLISPGTLASFQQAMRIRDAFFHNGQLSVAFGLTPVALDPTALSDSFSFNGQQYLYQHEPPRQWDMVWPVTTGDPSVTLTLTDLKGNPYSLSFGGDWALFRFVARGMAGSFGSMSNYTISFSLSGLDASYQVSTNSLQSAFDTSVVANFRCPSFD